MSECLAEYLIGYLIEYFAEYFAEYLNEYWFEFLKGYEMEGLAVLSWRVTAQGQHDSEYPKLMS